MARTDENHRRRPSSLALVLGLVLGVLTLAACGGPAGDGAAFDSIRAGNANADRVRPYDSVHEVVSYLSADDSDAVGLVIVGAVEAVEPGRSFRWEVNDSGARRIEVPADDQEAMISTFHLTVAVEESITDTADAALGRLRQVEVGLAMGPDVRLEDVEADYGNLTDAVFFLQRNRVFDYDSELWGIVEDGALVATPDENGYLSFPTLEARDPLQPEGLTVDSLKSHAKRQPD